MSAVGDGQAVAIGVGNVLLRDDGVGVRLVEALRADAERDPRAYPEGVRLVDGGTRGADLLPWLDGARCLLLLDALDLGRRPGTVSVLRGDEILAADGAWDGRAPGGVGELVSVARLAGRLPARVALVGVQVGDTAWGDGLSGPVAAALPSAVAAARAALRALDQPTGPGRPAAATRTPEGAGA